MQELENLACNIRKKIISVLSKNGGHLSSNLGVVELTIALHKVFDSPRDKFIFDVGHQTYAHKILTKRNKDFCTIRQFEGLSGFTNPEESIHDHFHSGHAGNAVSLGLGVAKTNNKNHTIPIIGDGALTCGLTLEAFNNIDKNLKRFIVVLNDNEMAISRNIGAISNILSRLINSPTSNKIYSEILSMISKIPGYGKFLENKSCKIKASIKNLVSTAPFFEQFGFSYVGPINGHDIKKLISTLRAIKNLSHPVLLHVMTKKGKGMKSAIENPSEFHGAKPFNIKTGEFNIENKWKKTFPKIFGEHILKMAEKDKNIIVTTPAMEIGSSLIKFKNKFPKRCIDVGIAEGHCVTFSGGLSFSREKKVISVIYSTFLQRAFDNIFHDVCLQNLPVIFAIDRASIAGGDGYSANGIYDIGFLKSIPNMIIVQPRNGDLLKELLESSVLWNKPTSIRYPNLETEETKSSLTLHKISKAQILEKGKDIAIIAVGHMYETALEVKNLLQEHGICPTIIDPIFIKPIDEALFSKIIKTHTHIVTIEEHLLISGFASIFNSFVIQKNFKNITITNIGIDDIFVTHGDRRNLLKKVKLTPVDITKKILQNEYKNSRYFS